MDNEPLAAEEGRVERFFINAVLVRVLFAHAPRFDGLYRWSSEVLALPALQRLLDGSTPTYAWDSEGDAQVWDFKPSTLARLGRWVVPVR